MKKPRRLVNGQDNFAGGAPLVFNDLNVGLGCLLEWKADAHDGLQCSAGEAWWQIDGGKGTKVNCWFVAGGSQS
jgi:hypothetical protein